MTIDPWAGQREQPKSLTRDDLLHLAALALWDAGVDDTEKCDHLAAVVLGAAYPLVFTADELDALPVGTVIVGPGGVVYFRSHHGGVDRSGGMDVGTTKVWQEYGLTARRESQALVRSGPWTVVHQRVTA